LSNFLFVCSKNQWRSPTAEVLFKNHPVHRARSAGTSDKAKIKVSQKLIDWATLIFAMEHKHKQMLKERFPLATEGKLIVVLDIEDIYRFNDPELIVLLKDGLSDYL